VGAKTGGTAMKRPLKTDHGAESERTRHSANDYEFFVAHNDPSFETRGDTKWSSLIRSN
jgi:hypothetical protein